MIKYINIKSNHKTELINITREVKKIVKELGVKEGMCTIFVPHTTAAVTINENADPDVKDDILKEINKIIPFKDNYKHIEENSAAHIKASLIGASETIIIENNEPILGTWQGIYFCEFDGPRNRRVIIKISDM